MGSRRMWKDKKYQRILLACILASFGAVVGFSTLSRTYINNLVYKERLNQMEEITHQMFRSLEDVIDNHWTSLEVQCNYLAYTAMETDSDLYGYLQRISALSYLAESETTLIAVDSAGRYYTAQGSQGLLREMSYLENNPEEVSYVSNSLTKNDSRMVFLKRLDTPISLKTGTSEISLCYFGFAQSMEQLNPYFCCDAYSNHNSVYVLDNSGLKLFNSNGTELIKGHNVYTVLSQMSYFHGSSFEEAKAQLHATGVCYSNAVLEGTEYFYSLKHILDMSRIESGKTTLNVEPMNLMEQINRIDSVIRQQARQRKQTLTLVTSELHHINVLSDPNRLNQILMNILSNAVKYTPVGGHIRLEVQELPRGEHYAKYRFIIEDDGIGMSEEYLKTIFDPFTREEKSGTNHVQGTGLGMAITKRVVNLMGGIIRVESTPGHGSRFEVVLEFPIDTAAEQAACGQAAPEAEKGVSPLDGMRFLCAEDNLINAEILEMLLESKGASCKICANGQEIVDTFAGVQPGEYDMILMDVQMPVMDGLEAARRIRSGENPLGKTIPILALTANAFLEDMQKSKDAGMNEHLSKPVDIATLEQMVRRFCKKP